MAGELLAPCALGALNRAVKGNTEITRACARPRGARPRVITKRMPRMPRMGQWGEQAPTGRATWMVGWSKGAGLWV